LPKLLHRGGTIDKIAKKENSQYVIFY